MTRSLPDGSVGGVVIVVQKGVVRGPGHGETAAKVAWRVRVVK